MTSNKITESLACVLIQDADIATAAGGCSCKISHIMPEVFRAAKTVILNRLKMPSPKRMVVNADLTESPLR